MERIYRDQRQAFWPLTSAEYANAQLRLRVFFAANPMTIESIRAFCLSLPHVAEDVKWESNLCFLIGGKMFAIVDLESASPRLAFKCTPEAAAELVEVAGIIPAPYLARYHWVSIVSPDAFRDQQVRECLKASYELVKAALPRKAREALETAPKRIKAKSRG